MSNIHIATGNIKPSQEVTAFMNELIALVAIAINGVAQMHSTGQALLPCDDAGLNYRVLLPKRNREIEVNIPADAQHVTIVRRKDGSNTVFTALKPVDCVQHYVWLYEGAGL